MFAYIIFAGKIRKCRICLINRSLELLFTKENKAILNMYKECTSLKASVKDPYSNYICTSCIQNLVKRHAFLTTCRMALKDFDRMEYNEDISIKQEEEIKKEEVEVEEVEMEN